MQTVRHGFPERIISIKDAPGRLEDRIQEAVSGGPVPQGVQSGADPDLVAPVDDLAAFLFQFLLSVSVQEFVVELLLCVGGKVLDF